MEKSNVVPLNKSEPNMLRCTKCGATTDAACECGVPYELLKPSKAAEIGIQQTPNLSDRAIAERIGVGVMTIGRARKQVYQNVTPARVGLDGKTYSIPKRKETFWTPEKEEEIMRLHKEGKGGKEISEILGITANAASGKINRLMLKRPDIKERRMPLEMPEDIRYKAEGYIAVAKTHMYYVDDLSVYVDQMHEDLRHLLAEEVEVVLRLSRDIIKRLVGDVRNIKSVECGVTIRVRKEDN